MPLTKHPWLYKAVDLAINAFGARHNVTARQHIAPEIGLTGENGSIQLGAKLNYTTYNPATPKSLSSDELIVIMDTIGNDCKIILDAIAKEYNGVFTFNVDQNITTGESLKDELLMISSVSGALASKFLEHKSDDGVIDEMEAAELERIAYEARSHLRIFEEMIKKHKVSVEE